MDPKGLGDCYWVWYVFCIKGKVRYWENNCLGISKCNCIFLLSCYLMIITSFAALLPPWLFFKTFTFPGDSLGANLWLYLSATRTFLPPKRYLQPHQDTCLTSNNSLYSQPKIPCLTSSLFPHCCLSSQSPVHPTFDAIEQSHAPSSTCQYLVVLPFGSSARSSRFLRTYL